MTELREYLISQVRFGCTFADVWEAMQEEKGKIKTTLGTGRIWWSSVDTRWPHDEAGSRGWIIAPWDATAAEIDATRRRWEEGERGKAPEPAAEPDEVSKPNAALEEWDEAIRSHVRLAVTLISESAYAHALQEIATARDLEAARDLVKKWGDK